jgi:amino acid transporter
VVQAAGPAAPLAFAIGMVAMALVALSFMAFTHRVAHAGSAYAYITHTFGSRMGFVAGWTLLLTYLGFGPDLPRLVGSFTSAALKGFGIDVGPWWIAIGGVSMLLGWWLAYRDMRLAGRLMLGLEGIAVIAIIFLCICILRQVHPDAEQIAASFRPAANFNGWAGLGFGMVFSILSFAGFEGAATLGEETINPRRNIPIALLGTVLGSGIFFVFVAYCEVIGFGPQGIKDLANSQAPLDDLALRFASPRLAIVLDIAAATSCFSGVIGAVAAAGRLVFALGRAGLSSTLAGVHPVHRTPAPAVSLAAFLIIAALPRLGALRRRRQLLQLFEHHRRARLDPDLHRRRRRRDGGGLARTAAALVGGLHLGAHPAALGALPQHLSGAGISQQSLAVRGGDLGDRLLCPDEAASARRQCAAAGFSVTAEGKSRAATAENLGPRRIGQRRR